jgi:hypothetical protein
VPVQPAKAPCITPQSAHAYNHAMRASDRVLNMLPDPIKYRGVVKRSVRCTTHAKHTHNSAHILRLTSAIRGALHCVALCSVRREGRSVPRARVPQQGTHALG